MAPTNAASSKKATLRLNEKYPTVIEEIEAHAARLVLEQNISIEEARARVDRARIIKNRKSRDDHLHVPANAIPQGGFILNTRSRSEAAALRLGFESRPQSRMPIASSSYSTSPAVGRATSALASRRQPQTPSASALGPVAFPSYHTPAAASASFTPPPMAPPGNKKGKDASRASASRNTTPNSVAGSSVGPTFGTTQYFGAQIQETIDFQPVLATHTGLAAPESATISKLSDKSSASILKSKTSYKDLKAASSQSDKLKVITKDLQADSERKAAAAGNDKKNKLKRKKPSSSLPDRPLAHGAHAATTQDGSHFGAAEHPGIRDPDDASSSLSPAQATPVATAVPDRSIDMDVDGQDDDSMEDVQPLPTRFLVDAPTFGDDPTTFDDPTEYEIMPVQPGMTDDEIRHCASVADFPHNDISHLTAGSPPDRDFTKGKPSNQVQATTFATYIEPYLRPYTEEDMAWLRERGDRRGPFVIPPLGKKSYKQVWAEEDNENVPEDAYPKFPSNEPRGSIDDMNDAIAETDELSTGPVMARFLSLLRNEHRQIDDSTGNASASNGDDEAGENDDLTAILEGSGSRAANSRAPFPPATRIAEPATEAGRSYFIPKLTSQETDQRLMQELHHIGFLEEGAEPDYSAAADDEVSGLMREMQAKLKTVMLENAARKSIIQERMPDHMAFQEYSQIKDDLDTQVTSAYQKRTRTMGKKGKKRAGGAGGGVNSAGGSMSGVAKPALDASTKAAMERRREWHEKVGPVFADQELGKVPTESIFILEAMAKHMSKEASMWDDEEAEAEDE